MDTLYELVRMSLIDFLGDFSCLLNYGLDLMTYTSYDLFFSSLFGEEAESPIERNNQIKSSIN